MKKLIKQLPHDAKFDYTDIFGHKIYHDKSNRYEVHKDIRWGRRFMVIYSEPFDREEETEQ